MQLCILCSIKNRLSVKVLETKVQFVHLPKKAGKLSAEL